MKDEFEIPAFDDAALAATVQHRLDRKTKPTGSLGQLESLALQLALIQQRGRPRLDAPQLVVFAADHGIAARGVSAYPSDVTAQMVANFLAGGAAVSVLARQHGLALTVVDCGVRHDFAPHPQLVVRKTAHGSADLVGHAAMSVAQCEAAMVHGRDVVRALPGNALLLGEMGIGNSSIAALLMQRLTGLPLARCTGRGTGVDDAGLAHKLGVLQTALERHADVHEPLAVLAALGGLKWRRWSAPCSKRRRSGAWSSSMASSARRLWRWLRRSRRMCSAPACSRIAQRRAGMRCGFRGSG